MQKNNYPKSKTTKIKRTILLVVSITFSVVLVYGINYISRAAPIASAYNAKILCSATFVSKRNPEDIINNDLSQFGYVSKDVDMTEKSVTASVYGIGKRKAIYREGLGCTLVQGGVSEEELRNQFKNNPVVLPKISVNNDLVDITKELPDYINQEKLAKAIDKAFQENNPELPKITRAIVVLHKGKIIAERYAENISKDTPMLGWSMTKSVTNALIGILVKQGKLSLNEHNLFPEWENDNRKDITIDSLMKMSSGLNFDEEYGSISDATKMLFREKDYARYAINKTLKVKSDTEWSYSSGTTNILSKIIRDKVGEADYHSFPYKELFYKIGMNSVVIEPDPSGTFVGSSFMYATTRDWAKFGQLYLQNGIWNNEKIFTDGWVKYSSTPAPKAPNGKYGAQFWLNEGNEDGERWDKIPKDIFKAQGFEGQSVVVCPSNDTVIVRLGLSKKSESWNLAEFVYDVIDSIKVKK